MTKEEILFEVQQIDKEIEIKNKRKMFLLRQLDQVDILEREYRDTPQLLQE